MNSTVSLTIKIVLGLLVLYLGYTLYSIIMEPIEYEKIKDRRYTKVIERLEQIREAQKAHRDLRNSFASNFDELIAFVDTADRPIVERKDSTFTYYDEVYQQDMQKDTIVKTILGYESVREYAFDKSFDIEQLRYIPFTNGKTFTMDADKIKINDIVVPVFEAKAPDTLIFRDVLDQYDQFIDNKHALTIGSLNEPTLSGNWK